MNRTDKSTPVQIRMSLENLATIMEYVISSGYKPESVGKGMSVGVEMFATILVNNSLAKSYDLRQAIDFLEPLGFFANLRVNKKVFANWAANTRIKTLPPGVSAQEFQEILRKVEDGIETLPPVGNDLAVPPGADQVLAELEQGIATGKISLAEPEQIE